MIDARAANIKSGNLLFALQIAHSKKTQYRYRYHRCVGWKSIFAVFRAAASDPDESIVALAFAKVNKLFFSLFDFLSLIFIFSTGRNDYETIFPVDCRCVLCRVCFVPRRLWQQQSLQSIVMLSLLFPIFSP